MLRDLKEGLGASPREGIYSFQPKFDAVQRGRRVMDSKAEQNMKGLAELYSHYNEHTEENKEVRDYLLNLLRAQKEGDVKALQELQWELQNQKPFDERFKEIKKQSYTIQMSEQDLREQNRYQAFYNANKLAYHLDPNNKNVLN